MRKVYISICMLLLAIVVNCSQGPKLNPNSTEAITGDDITYHVNFLAADELQGREAGSDGERKAGNYIAGEFKRLGLEPAGKSGSYFHTFEVVAGVTKGKNNTLQFETGSEPLVCEADSDFVPVAFTENDAFEGEVAFAGYGIDAPDLKYNDYESVDVKDKIVAVLRYSPEGDNPHSDFYNFSSLRRKATTARDKGAKAILFVTGPKNDQEDVLMALKYDGTAARSGIGAVNITRSIANKFFESAGQSLESVQNQIDESKKPMSFLMDGVRASINTDVRDDRRAARNVAALLEGYDPQVHNELVIIGAHYDHLGFGGPGSLDSAGHGNIHNGADDNASGTAGLLELAQKLTAEKENLKRSYLFLAFSAEERGLLGSSAYVKEKVTPLDNAVAMINMDMIGRMKENQLILYGLGTSPDWEKMLDEINEQADFGFDLKKNKDGIGPSDHSTFYQAGLPVLALFTGIHSDYHKPSDDADKINSQDEARVLKFAYQFVKKLDAIEEKPQFTKVESTERRETRRGFRVYVGTIPDYAETDVEGLKLSGVSSGSPAEKIGLQGGDIITKFGEREIKNIYDYTYALQDFKPGDEIDIMVKRGNEELTFKMKLQARRR
ncbi:MAG: M20/M25/M40 family metallo-hydrolase [bacterium]